MGRYSDRIAPPSNNVRRDPPRKEEKETKRIRTEAVEERTDTRADLNEFALWQRSACGHQIDQLTVLRHGEAAMQLRETAGRNRGKRDLRTESDSMQVR